jgi:hypothetical protein
MSSRELERVEVMGRVGTGELKLSDAAEVIRHNGRYLQMQPGQRRYGPTQSKALVCEWEDGAMEVYYRGERIVFIALKEPLRKISQPLPPAARVIVVRQAKKDHPWRRGYQNMKPWIPKRGNAEPLAGMRTYASP